MTDKGLAPLGLALEMHRNHGNNLLLRFGLAMRPLPHKPEFMPLAVDSHADGAPAHPLERNPVFSRSG